MNVVKPPFRYVGSKWRLLKKINFNFPKFKRIVEPYAGSCSFSMNFNKSFIAYDINHDLIVLWNWLKNEATEKRLLELSEIVSAHDDKTDVRNIGGLSNGEIVYVRINMTGLFVGQLSSWKIYKQFNLPIKNTIVCLNQIRNGMFINATSDKYLPLYGDLVFIDPPYNGSKANYIDKTNKIKYDIHNIDKVEELLNKIQYYNLLYIFTYGDGALIDFPKLKWTKIISKSMPNTHNGGYKIRNEYITSNIPFEVLS